MCKILLDKAPGVVQNIVKSIFIADWKEETDALIRLCGGATRVFLPTQMTSTNNNPTGPINPIFLTLIAFRNVTHLALSDFALCFRSLQLELLPNLCYLAYGINLEVGNTTVHLVQRVFRKCADLEMLLLLVSGGEMVEKAMGLLAAANLVIPRLYVGTNQSLLSSWKGHMGGCDIWAKAKQSPCSSIMYWKETYGVSFWV